MSFCSARFPQRTQQGASVLLARSLSEVPTCRREPAVSSSTPWCSLEVVWTRLLVGHRGPKLSASPYTRNHPTHTEWQFWILSLQSTIQHRLRCCPGIVDYTLPILEEKKSSPRPCLVVVQDTNFVRKIPTPPNPPLLSPQLLTA